MVALGVVAGLQSLQANDEKIGTAASLIGLGTAVGTLTVLLAILRGRKS